MAKQTINIGSIANDGTGSTLRAAGDLVNDNFNEIYAAIGDGTTLTDILAAGYITASSTSTLTNKSGNISQWTNDSGYLTSISETNDLTSAVTWANVPDANITESSVTQHQSAINSGVSITESQISDLQSYITAGSTTALTNKTFDANGTGNSISNIEVADLASGVLDTDLSSVSASDDTLASAKAIKAYVDAQNANQMTTFTISDDSSTTSTITESDTLQFLGGTGIGSTVSGDTVTFAIDSSVTTNSGTQTLTNKTIDSASNTLTLDLGEGTLTGTTAEFNTALQDGSFATLAGTETLTNKTINSASNTITITESDISDLGSYITASSTDTLTNKTISD